MKINNVNVFVENENKMNDLIEKDNYAVPEKKLKAMVKAVVCAKQIVDNLHLMEDNCSTTMGCFVKSINDAFNMLAGGVINEDKQWKGI